MYVAQTARRPWLRGPYSTSRWWRACTGFTPAWSCRPRWSIADGEFVVVRTDVAPGDADGHPEGPRRGMAMFRIADGPLAEQ